MAGRTKDGSRGAVPHRLNAPAREEKRWLSAEGTGTVLRSCTRCGGKQYFTQAKVDYAVAVPCERCLETCITCNGEGHIFEEHEAGFTTARECPVCGALKRRIRLFNQAHLPARYHDKDFLGFKTYLDVSLQQRMGNLIEIKNALYTAMGGFMEGDKGFLLVGSVGTGKTHLLTASVRYLTLDKGIPCRFIEFTHLLSELRLALDRKDKMSELLDRLSNVPVLAIDELGKGRKTEWELSVIDELISKRYNRCLSTFFTSNYELDSPRVTASSASSGSTRGHVDTEDRNFQRQYDTESLVDRLGQSVVSRLHEMAQVLPIREATDFRKIGVAYG